MLSTKSIGLFVVATLASLSATACSVGAADDAEVGPDDLSSTTEDAESAVRAPTQLGSFKLYDLDVNSADGFCLEVTTLDLVKVGRTTTAKLSEHIEGMCRRTIAPNFREYKVRAKSDGCGTVTYTGERRVSNRRGINVETGLPLTKQDNYATLTISDNRKRTCETPVAGPIVIEEALPGFPGPISSIKRSLPEKSEPEVLEGTLMSFQSIGGGASTGKGLVTQSGLVELALNDEQSGAFVSDRAGRVVGTRNASSGLFTVKTLLVCPPPGTRIDLAPTISPDAVVAVDPSAPVPSVVSDKFWEVDHCPGVSATRI